MKKLLSKLKQIKLPEKFKIILTLFSFAVTQPVFDVLNKNQEFFIASNFSSLHILLLAFLLAFILPLLIYSIVFLLIKTFKPLGKIAFWFSLFFLFALFSMIILSKFSILSDIKFLIVVLLLSFILTLLLLKFENFKKILTFLSISSVLFFAIFLAHNKLIMSGIKSTFDKDLINDITIKNPHPIFIIVFDEFPINSLLDINGNIDEVLFPNFASLLDDFIWYKNTTTVSDSTTSSIPAILTGNYPKENFLPTNSYYPNNIFNILKYNYHFVADEPYSNMCPKNLCISSQSNNIDKKSIILSDLFLVYKYMVLPENKKNELPFNNDKWNNFNNKNTLLSNNLESNQKNTVLRYSIRDVMFHSFLDIIESNENYNLYFHHIELPHVPYIYLPSGKRYRADENQNLGLIGDKWDKNEWLIKQYYQKHLLQVVFTDNLLGEFLKKLKTLNIYDESLIILTADHGVSFRPNDERRSLTSSNFQEIVSVPLFIKTSSQDTGGVSNIHAQTIDIIPTIFDGIELSKKFSFEGKSLLDNRNEETGRIIYYDGAKKSDLINEITLYDNLNQFLNQKYTNLETNSSDFNKIYKIGNFPEIYGLRTESFYFGNNLDMTVSIDNEFLYEKVNILNYFIPSLVSGYINSENDIWNDITLAISINGVIGATTQTTKLENERIYWSGVVNEEMFVNGFNLIEIYQVFSEGNKLELLKFEKSVEDSYSLTIEDNSIKIKNNESKKILEVNQEYGLGVIDNMTLNEDLLKVRGWAVDSINKITVKNVIIFINNKFSGIVETTEKRKDLAEAFNVKNYLFSGYNFAITINNIKKEDLRVRVFAISKDNKAWELFPTDSDNAKL